MKKFCKSIIDAGQRGGGRHRKFRRLFLLLALSYGPAQHAMAQQPAGTTLPNFGLSSAETQIIVQKCLDLPAMQKYYPVDAAKAQRPVNVVQLPIVFPADVAVRKGGQRVNFIKTNKAEYAHRTNPAAYAIFRTIEHTGDAVQVHFNYFYKTGPAQTLEPLFVVVALKKSGNDWQVVNSSVNE